MFSHLREVTLKTLIVSYIFLTFSSILAIWEVFDKEVLEKSLATMMLVFFSSMLIVAASLAGENKFSFDFFFPFGNKNKPASRLRKIIQIVVLIIILLFLIPRFLGLIFFGF